SSKTPTCSDGCAWVRHDFGRACEDLRTTSFRGSGVRSCARTEPGPAIASKMASFRRPAVARFIWLPASNGWLPRYANASRKPTERAQRSRAGASLAPACRSPAAKVRLSLLETELRSRVLAQIAIDE